MKIYIEPGKYVLAISGGVDSMVLLDLLAKQANPNVELVVAHFNHGIRPDSALDERLVQKFANNYKLTREIGYGRLGPKTSEATARKARYDFLELVRQKHQAKLVITAHHQDDLIETAILNVLRGTGRRGVSAISQNPEVIRPLLKYPKEEILEYAKKNQIEWREDSTNQDETYLRNYVRANIVTKLSKLERLELLQNTDKVAKNGSEVDQIIATLSHSVKNDDKINRYKFSILPNEIGQELAMLWLREMDVRQYDKKTIEKLCIALKTAKKGTKFQLMDNVELLVQERFAYLRLIRLTCLL